MKSGQKKSTSEKTYSKKSVEVNYRLQRFFILYGVVPVVIYTIIRFVLGPVWQNGLLCASSLATLGALYYALRLAKRGRLVGSMLVIGIAMILFQTVAMVIQKDVYVAGFSGLTVVLVYAASFSAKHLYGLSVGVIVSLTVAVLSHFFGIVEPLELSPSHHLFYLFFFVIFTFVTMVAALRRTQIFQRKLVASVRTLNKEQQDVLDAAGQKTGQLEENMKRVRSESKVVADRIYEQVSSVGEIVEAMGQIGELSHDTADASAHAAEMAMEVSQKSIEGKRRLDKMEESFVEVVMANDVVRFEFGDLADKAENIGDILLANREIISQIKILAINAGIQAAKAGDFGLGFAVVARELKAMIQRTEESMNNVSQLLEYIRTQARQSADRIAVNSENMHRQLTDINSTGKLFEHITEAFREMSEAVNSINRSNNTQQGMLDELGFGVSSVDSAAEQLLNATVALIDNVAEITSSHTALLQLLKSESVMSPKQSLNSEVEA